MLTLNSLSLHLWVAIMAAQVCLAVTLQRARAPRRYPAFCAYIYFGLIAGVITPFSVGSGNRMLAFWTYCVCALTEAILTFFSALEIYRLIFGPNWAMPEWAPRRVATMIGTALGLALAFFAILRPVNGGPHTQWLTRFQFCATFILLATFIILFGYSRRLGFTWTTRCASIAGGFVLYLAVALIGQFAMAELSISVAVIVGHIGMAVYLTSLLWWGWALYGKERSVARPTAEELRRIDAEFARCEEAVGVR